MHPVFFFIAFSFVFSAKVKSCTIGRELSLSIDNDYKDITSIKINNTYGFIQNYHFEVKAGSARTYTLQSKTSRDLVGEMHLNWNDAFTVVLRWILTDFKAQWRLLVYNGPDLKTDTGNRTASGDEVPINCGLSFGCRFSMAASQKSWAVLSFSSGLFPDNTDIYLIQPIRSDLRLDTSMWQNGNGVVLRIDFRSADHAWQKFSINCNSDSQCSFHEGISNQYLAIVNDKLTLSANIVKFNVILDSQNSVLLQDVTTLKFLVIENDKFYDMSQPIAKAIHDISLVTRWKFINLSSPF